MKRYMGLVVKIVFTILVLYVLARHINFVEVYRIGRAGDPYLFSAALLLVLVQSYVAMLRWHLVLHTLGTPQPLGLSLRIFWGAMFFGSFLPAGLASDGVRIWITRQGGVELSHSINSVLLDRIAGLVGIIAVAVGALPFATSLYPSQSLLYGIPILAVVTIASLVGLSRFNRLSPHWRIFGPFIKIAEHLRVVVRARRALATVLMAALFCAVSQSLIVYLIGRGLNIQISLIDYLALVPLIVLLTTLPVSLGGWGIREGAMVALFGVAGLPAADALALSVLYGLSGVICSLPGGIVWLMWRSDSTGHLRVLAKSE
jgi:uncharacterized membrane protein YbhN (UPF0104 family)